MCRYVAVYDNNGWRGRPSLQGPELDPAARARQDGTGGASVPEPGSPWRDAATVIAWVRGPAGRLRVLMLKRPATQPGWPGLWVFPGGGVSPEDRQSLWLPAPGGAAMSGAPAAIHQEAFMTWATPWFLAHLGAVPDDRWPPLDGDPLGSRAASVAAARELWEEAGVWLGPALSVPAVAKSRRLGLWPGPLDVSRLRYWGRLATPPHEVRRFDCRFFGVDLSEGDWPAARGAAGEVERLAWRDPAEALAAGSLPLPTRYVLENLDRLVLGRAPRV